MGILVVTVNFTVSEAEFLASVLAQRAETAPVSSAERFWMEQLHNRVRQEVMDVVASDAAARLASSSAPAGFGMPMPAAPIQVPAASCTCGHITGSKACSTLYALKRHP